MNEQYITVDTMRVQLKLTNNFTRSLLSTIRSWWRGRRRRRDSTHHTFSRHLGLPCLSSTAGSYSLLPYRPTVHLAVDVLRIEREDAVPSPRPAHARSCCTARRPAGFWRHLHVVPSSMAYHARWMVFVV